MSVMNVMLMLATVVMTVAMMSTGMGHSDRGDVVENTEDAINSHEATLHQVEDYSRPDISTPGEGIDRAMDRLEPNLHICIKIIK